jgi:hypothetical protein
MIIIWIYEIWSILGHSKVHDMFFSSIFFYQTLYIYVFFALRYHILNPYQIFQIKTIKKNIYIKVQPKINSYFSISKIRYYMFGVIYVIIFLLVFSYSS